MTPFDATPPAPVPPEPEPKAPPTGCKQHGWFNCDQCRAGEELTAARRSLALVSSILETLPQGHPEPEPKAPERVSHFECDHCGDVAIESNDGMFTDGDGGECASCGMPGQVSMDAETDPYWNTSQEEGDRCNRKDCEDCEDCADIPLVREPPAPVPPESVRADAELIVAMRNMFLEILELLRLLTSK